jgi:hypothetical protein
MSLLPIRNRFAAGPRLAARFRNFDLIICDLLGRLIAFFTSLRVLCRGFAIFFVLGSFYAFIHDEVSFLIATFGDRGAAFPE